jgi:hypothetical protein
LCDLRQYFVTQWLPVVDAIAGFIAIDSVRFDFEWVVRQHGFDSRVLRNKKPPEQNRVASRRSAGRQRRHRGAGWRCADAR